MASAELIEDLAVHGNRIVVKPGHVFRSQFLAEDFFVEYDADVTLSTLSESVLAIPFLLNVMPLVWRSGHSYRIPVLDGRLATALDDVRDGFRRIYPDVAWDGELRSDRTDARPPADERGSTAVLFSGGVDSAYSSLIHRDAVKYQITIRSLLGRWDWQGEQARAAAQAYFQGCAAVLGCESAFVTSNVRSFISEAKLVGIWPDPRRWMIEVQHGLGLVGLCAPLTGPLEIGRLLMASCERDHRGLAGGSHPDIVNAIRWAGVEVRLDGVERTRQEKLQAIGAALADANAPFELRPCLRPTAGFGNCGACEKCLQTIVGLVGAGLDPHRYGFPTGLPSALSTLREQVRGRRLPMPDAGELLQWQEIQGTMRQRCAERARIGLPGPDDSADLAWFADLDLEAYFHRCHHGPRHVVRTLRRRLGLFVDRWPSFGRGLRRALRSD